MKIRLSFLALGLVALLGSLLASSQRISAHAATDRLSASPVSGPSVLGTGKTPLGGSILAPGITLTYTTYLPVVMRPVEGIFGYLTENGAPAGGISLELRFWNGGYSTVATTTTNSSGFYLFSGVPVLGGGQSYYVRYANLENNNSRLGFWGSRDVTSYALDSSVALGTSDLANIFLTAPGSGATVALPYTFQWTRRPATPSDSYLFELFDPYGPTYASTTFMGYVSGVPVTSLPSGFYPNVQYGWDVLVRDPNLGVGYSYYWRPVKFSNSGAGLSSLPNFAPGATGRRADLPPRNRSEK